MSSTTLTATTNRSSSINIIPAIIVGTLTYTAVCKWFGLSLIRRKSVDKDSESFPQSVTVTLPKWICDEQTSYYSKIYKTDEEMMELAIYLSARNVSENTGGPFGCAIFERNLDTGYATLVSVGVNRVVTLGNSTLHGEVVAIQMAQKQLKSFTLRLPSFKVDSSEDEKKNDDKSQYSHRQFELFTSCEPCAMCLGATLWSGVSRIVCGASKDDATAIGFDEGPVFDESYDHLVKAGIEVKRCVLKEQASQVLKDYGANGLIYNR